MINTTSFPQHIEMLSALNGQNRTVEPADEAPMPLMREMSDSEPFPLESLGKVVANAGRSIQKIIQAPDAVCGQSLLAACAMAVQSYANVVIDGREYPLSNYFLTVAESGERKSAVDTVVLKSVREFERILAEQEERDSQNFQDKMEIFESERKRVLAGKNREEKESGLKTLGQCPKAPLCSILLLSDPTYEGLFKHLAKGLPALGLFSDEGGKFFGGHGMSEDNQLKTAAGLSSLWDGKALDRIRSGDGSSKLFGRRLSGHLMIQPIVAEQLFSNPILGGQGFLSRCLICQPKSTAGSRPYQEFDLESDEALNKYHARIAEILRTPMPIEDGKVNELSPRRLPLLGETKTKWIAFYNAVEKNLGASGEFSGVRAFGSKAPEHCLRIAGVLTLMENLDAGQITSEALDSAIAITRFYLGEALRICGSSCIDPNLTAAKKLLSWLGERNQEFIDLPSIYQNGPRSIRDRSEAKKAVKVLEEHRWLGRVEGGMEVDGKHRRDVWRVRS